MEQNKHKYIVNYQVGGFKGRFIVVNHIAVPQKVLTTMASEKIELEINEGCFKDETEKSKNKLRNKSIIEVDDISEVKTYKLGLNFTPNGEITNDGNANAGEVSVDNGV